MSSQPTSWSDASQSWYDEERDFIYGVGPKRPDAVIGHYTQVRETNKNLFCHKRPKKKISPNFD